MFVDQNIIAEIIPENFTPYTPEQSRAVRDAQIEEQIKVAAPAQFKRIMTYRNARAKIIALKAQATIDGLTGLLNQSAGKKAFETLANQAKRDGKQLVIINLDMDFFKSINDVHGHPVGDEAIKLVAQAIRNVFVRPLDARARMGGEEFTVAFIADEETSCTAALRMSEKLRVEIEKNFVGPEKNLRQLTASVGISIHDPAAETFDEAFRRSDDAGLVSKKQGRNRVTMWASKDDKPEYVSAGKPPKPCKKKPESLFLDALILYLRTPRQKGLLPLRRGPSASRSSRRDLVA